MYLKKRFFCLSACLFSIACTPNIPPWERGILAKAHMAPQSSALEASLRHHMQISKEASSGGHNAGGGGCGCN